jgi:DNA-binding PadR family transcriptional regulator
LTIHTQYLHTEYVAVREALLALLADSPRHGYELKTEFESVTGHVWLLNVGQVYTTLDRLERDGLVRPLSEAVSDPTAVTATAVTATAVTATAVTVTAKRAYEITHAGREELSRWYSEADADEPPPRDEALLKVLLASARSAAEGLAVVTEQRKRGLDQLRKLRVLPAADDLSANIVRDARSARIEGELAWLDRCEARLVLAAKPSRGGNS